MRHYYDAWHDDPEKFTLQIIAASSCVNAEIREAFARGETPSEELGEEFDELNALQLKIKSAQENKEQQ